MTSTAPSSFRPSDLDFSSIVAGSSLHIRPLTSPLSSAQLFLVFTTGSSNTQHLKSRMLGPRQELATISLGVFVKPPISNSSQQAALAHLGERQTEVHFTSSCIRSILEALCSIHRSGIDISFVPLTISQWPSLLPGFWLFCDSPSTTRLGIINP